ncbi:hypothetical protein K9N68_00080 [Kovacikia minuta CCNUW1]|nr:hypothetical protein [Kovacikia minuta]UBF26456.1 hypothetical protein K9N68_00080 [Kovacikia minuta CCNUW1]
MACTTPSLEVLTGYIASEAAGAIASISFSIPISSGTYPIPDLFIDT